jgi:hypothetical protein
MRAEAELVNLCLFFLAIAKTALYTGLGPAMVWAALRGSRTKFAVREKVSGGRAVSPALIPANSQWATSRPRKDWGAA